MMCLKPKSRSSSGRSQDEVVEGADERRWRRDAVELLARQDVEGHAAVVDLDLAQPALGHERVEVRLQARASALQAPVLTDRGLGQRTAGADREQ